MNAQPAASFVLCSKNGGTRLKTCLARIAELSGPASLQVVLVDNGSSDDSYEVMQAWAAHAPFHASAHQTHIPGNSAGRNVGLEHATGEVIVFIDDDCYVDKDMVNDWIEVFRTPGIGYGSGRIDPFNPANSMLGCNVEEKQKIVPAGWFIRRGLIQGSNMAFRRRCLEEAGPFDARFGAGTRYAGEEWDVALRASFAGWSGGYFPTPTVSHDHGRDDSDARERLLFYDYGAGAVYAKNTFRRMGWKVIRHFLREARWLGTQDAQRRATLVKGYRDFFITGRR